MNYLVGYYNFLNKSLRLLGITTAASMAIMCSIKPILAQDTPTTITADQSSLNSTSLQAILSQIVENVRNRQLNTVATVIWPILPQESWVEENLEDKEIGRILISNSQFFTLNKGSKRDLIQQDPSAKKIFDLLQGNISELEYVNQLLESSQNKDSNIALAVGLDRRRVLEILETYSGANFTVNINNGQEIRKIDDLVWEFIPYKDTLPDGMTYYRFKVNVKAENLGITINGQPGSKIPLKFTMSLRDDPDMPPIRSFNSFEVQRDIDAISEVTAKQSGAGETNPLLLLVGLSSGQFAQQVGTALLNSGNVSAIAGVVYSSRGTDGAAGVNTTVYTINKTAEVGVAAALSGGEDLYLGPSVSVGSGTLVLSPGFVVDTDGDTRFSGMASLDLSRLLFGKPGTENLGGKTIEIPPQEIKGIFTSKEILSGNPIVRIILPIDQKGKTITISNAFTDQRYFIESEGFALISDLEPDTYAIRICEPGGGFVNGVPSLNCGEVGTLVVSPDTNIQTYQLSDLIP